LSSSIEIPAADPALFRILVENAVDLIVCGDAQRRRTYVSPSSRELLGFEPEELLGRGGYDLVHPDDMGRVHSVFGAIGPALPSAKLAFRMRRKDGSYLWVEGCYRHLAESGGILAILRDISAQKHAEDLLAEANARLEAANAELEALANLDGLTGLGNRRQFDKVAESEFRRARRHRWPLGLVLLDVDCFKLFNDRYGHLAGDDCLRQVGRAIGGTLKRPGDFSARFGGEELVAVLPATDANGALAMAEAMRAAVEALGLAHAESPSGRLTISAGAAAILPARDADTVDDLIGAADQALYAAKTSGRNRVSLATPRRPVPAGCA
jgi:diguanylate cyclase (GGDEF)-like protein/PAS domain S-box-containing protein